MTFGNSKQCLLFVGIGTCKHNEVYRNCWEYNTPYKYEAVEYWALEQTLGEFLLNPQMAKRLGFDLRTVGNPEPEGTFPPRDGLFFCEKKPAAPWDMKRIDGSTWLGEAFDRAYVIICPLVTKLD